jgi:hypothetical protein
MGHHQVSDLQTENNDDALQILYPFERQGKTGSPATQTAWQNGTALG